MMIDILALFAGLALLASLEPTPAQMRHRARLVRTRSPLR